MAAAAFGRQARGPGRLGPLGSRDRGRMARRLDHEHPPAGRSRRALEHGLRRSLEAAAGSRGRASGRPSPAPARRDRGRGLGRRRDSAWDVQGPVPGPRRGAPRDFAGGRVDAEPQPLPVRGPCAAEATHAAGRADPSIAHASPLPACGRRGDSVLVHGAPGTDEPRHQPRARPVAARAPTEPVLGGARGASQHAAQVRLHGGHPRRIAGACGTGRDGSSRRGGGSADGSTAWCSRRLR